MRKTTHKKKNKLVIGFKALEPSLVSFLIVQKDICLIPTEKQCKKKKKRL